MNNLLTSKWLQNLQFLLALASIMNFLGTKWANNPFKEGLYVRRRRENLSIGLKHALLSNKRATNPFKEGYKCAEGSNILPLA